MNSKKPDEYTQTVIDQIISLLYQINELPYRYTSNTIDNRLKYALEFAGFSHNNRYETINGNVIGSRAASRLRALDLASLEEYRDTLQRQLDEFNQTKRYSDEIERKRQEELRRQEEEENYIQEHGMFGIFN